MAAPKGSKNAKKYQDTIVAKNKSLIEEELIRLKASRGTFNSLTALSRAISIETGLSEVTLRRNNTYRSLIIEFISHQSGRSGYVSRAESELLEVRRRVTELELTLSNVSADNLRLKAYLARNRDELDQAKRSSHIPVTDVDEATWEDKCLRTFYLVQAVLSRADFLVNVEDGNIEDVIGVGDEQIVAGRNISAPYIEWLKKGEN
jgi:hypothetical protein